jgi:hypothetical protein
MTLVTYHETGRSGSHPSSLTSFFRPVLSAALKLRNEWHRRQTEKMLEALPSDIRKDIGWPTSVQGPVHRP